MNFHSAPQLFSLPQTPSIDIDDDDEADQQALSVGRSTSPTRSTESGQLHT